MQTEIKATLRNISFLNKPNLKEAASMVKFFLIELSKNTSSWNVWKKLAISTVIQILDILDGEL